MPLNLKISFSYFLLILLGFLPFVVIGFFSFPMGDDFNYAVKGNELDMIEISINEYMTWNGRYFSNLLVVLNPIRFHSFLAYRLMPIFWVFSLSVCLVYFLKSLFNELSIGKLWLLSFMIILFYTNKLPIISEGLFWFTGAVTYWLGLIFFIIYTTVAIRYYRKMYKNEIFQRFVLGILLILAMGFNEVASLWLLSAHLFSLFYSNLRSRFWPYIVLCVILFCIVYFAPGNLVRAEYFPIRNEIFNSLKMTFLQMARFTVIWLFSYSSLSIVILLVAFKTELLIYFGGFLEKIRFRYLLFWYLMFLFLSIFPAYWATGILGQHRTLNMSCFVFVISFIIGFLKIIQSQKLKWFNHDYRKEVLILVAFLLIFASGNHFAAMMDILTGEANKFYKEMTYRCEIIKNDKGEKIILDPIVAKPRCLLNYEITSNPNSWENFYYNLYFKQKRQIMIRK